MVIGSRSVSASEYGAEMTGQLNSNGIAPIDDEDDFKFEDLGDGMAIVTYPVDRGACDDRYCPYCNSCPLDGVTDEHVYPQSIGGDGRTVIGVCKRCNNKAGANVDVWVSRQSWLKSLAFRSGNLMKRHEEHESTAKLKDGRMLVGHFYWINVGKNAARPAFQPLKTQPDGSKWITEHACQDSAKLPADINVYREDMLDKASFKLQLPEGAGLESAMIKILLG